MTPKPRTAALRLLPTLELAIRALLRRPLLLIPVGYPAADAEVPDLERKPLTDILVEF